MKSFVFLLIVLSLFCCQSDEINPKSVGYENIIVSDFIRDQFSFSAKLLYFHEIITNPLHKNYDDPILDNTEIEKILKIIQAVYDLDSKERDDVFVNNSIGARYCYSFNKLNLKVETEAPEVINFIAGIIPTGNTTFDNILNSYEFELDNMGYNYPNTNWIGIKTSKEYNMLPVEEEIKSLISVIDTESNKLCIGDGNTITLERDANMARITFSVKWGDCFSGCIHAKFWEFIVANGKAHFIKAYEN